MSLPATIGGGHHGGETAPSGMVFHSPGAASHHHHEAEAPVYEQPAVVAHQVVAVPVPTHSVEAVEVEAPVKDETDASAPTPALEGWSLKLAIGLIIVKFILGIVLLSPVSEIPRFFVPMSLTRFHLFTRFCSARRHCPHVHLDRCVAQAFVGDR